MLDLNVPDLSSMGAISEFCRRRADLPIVVLSWSDDARDVRKAIALGALGYVSKSASQQSLTAASLALIRELLEVASPADDIPPEKPADQRPPCPCCGGIMIVIETFASRWQPRGPPPSSGRPGRRCA